MGWFKNLKKKAKKIEKKLTKSSPRSEERNTNVKKSSKSNKSSKTVSNKKKEEAKAGLRTGGTTPHLNTPKSGNKSNGNKSTPSKSSPSTKNTNIKKANLPDIGTNKNKSTAPTLRTVKAKQTDTKKQEARDGLNPSNKLKLGGNKLTPSKTTTTKDDKGKKTSSITTNNGTVDLGLGGTDGKPKTQIDYGNEIFGGKKNKSAGKYEDVDENGKGNAHKHQSGSKESKVDNLNYYNDIRFGDDRSDSHISDRTSGSEYDSQAREVLGNGKMKSEKGDSPYMKFQINSYNNMLDAAQKAYDRGDTEKAHEYIRKAEEYEKKYNDAKSAKDGYAQSDQLTSNEALLLQTLGRSGNTDYTQKGLQAASQTYAGGDTKKEYGDIAGKVAKGYAHDVNTNPGAQGFIAGTQWIPVTKTVEASTGNDNMNLTGADTGFYNAGEMAGVIASSVAGGIGVKAATEGRNIGRIGEAAINMIVDAPSNAVLDVGEAKRSKEEGKQIPASINEDTLATSSEYDPNKMKNSYIDTDTEPGTKGRKSLKSIDSWNEDDVKRAYERAKELGKDESQVVFGKDKNGYLHYAFDQETLDAILQYYDNAENPTYSLYGKEYSDSDALRVGKQFAKDEAVSGIFGAVTSKGIDTAKAAKKAEQAAETERKTAKIAEETAEKKAEQTAEKAETVKVKAQEKETAKNNGVKASSVEEGKTEVKEPVTKKAEEKPKSTSKTESAKKTEKTEEIKKKDESVKASEKKAETSETKIEPKKQKTTKKKESLKTTSEDRSANDLVKSIEYGEKKLEKAKENVKKTVSMADKKAKPTSETSQAMKQFGDEHKALTEKYEYERAAKVKEVEEYISEYKGKGVDHVHHNIEGSEINGVPTEGYSTRVSNNEPWYREFYAEHGRKPYKKEIKALAEKIVTDVENGNKGIIDLDFDELENVKKTVDGYAEGLEEQHKLYYPDYTDAEFEVMVKTGLEKSDWTDQMKRTVNLRKSGDVEGMKMPKRKLATKAEKVDIPESADKKVVTTSTGSTVPEEAVGATRNQKPPVYKESKSHAADVLEEETGARPTYEAETHKGRAETAAERLDTDFEGEVKDLTDSNKDMTSEDVVTAGHAYDELKAQGRDDDARRLMRNVSSNSSEAGQKLESLKQLKNRDKDSAVYEAYMAENRGRREFEKANPKQWKESNDAVDEISKIFDDAKDAKTAEEFKEKVAKGLDELDKSKGVNNSSLKKEVNKIVDQTLNGKTVEDVVADNNLKMKSAKVSDMEKSIDKMLKAAQNARNPEEFYREIEKTLQKMEEAINKQPKKAETLRTKVDNLNTELDNLKSGRQTETGNFVPDWAKDKDNITANLIDNVRDEIYRRTGIPTLTGEQADEISRQMRIAEEATTEQARKDAYARADKILHSLERAMARDKFKSLQRISLLTNPKTLLSRNAGGNLLLKTAETIKDAPAAMVDAGLSKILGTDRTTTMLSAGKYSEGMKGFGRGAKSWGHDLRNGLDTSRPNSKYEYGQAAVWNADQVNGKLRKGAYKAANFADNVVKYGLKLGDEPFYRSAYDQRLAELKTLAKRGKNSMSAEQMAEEAERYALEATFQNNSTLSQVASNIKNLSKVTDNETGVRTSSKIASTLIDVFVPFTQTPANVLDKLIDYSPAGFVRGLVDAGREGKKGVFNQKKFVDRMGRSLTGFGAIMAGYALAKNGMDDENGDKKVYLTTNIYNDSDSSQEYSLRKLLGEQDYSLVVDGTSYSIDWANPVGSLLIMGADAANEGVKGSDFFTKEGLATMKQAGLTAADTVFSQSFLSSVSELMENNSYDDSGVASKIGSHFEESATSQLSPSITTALAKIIDPVKRETYDDNKWTEYWNEIKSKTPFLSKTLPAKVDLNGNTQYQYQGRNVLSRAYEALLAPYNKTVHQDNAVNEEVLRLYNATGQSGVLLDTVSSSKGTFTYNDKKYTITDAKLLTEMQRNIGKEATEGIQKLMNKKSWNNLSDDEKAEKIAEVNKQAMFDAEEKYLVGNKIMTQEQFDKTTLSKNQKKLVGKGGITATDLRTFNTKLEKQGITGEKDSSLAEAVAIRSGFDDKKLKAYGFKTSTAGSNGAEWVVTGYERSKYFAESDVSVKTYLDVTDGVKSKADLAKSVEAYNKRVKKNKRLDYDDVSAIYYARFGTTNRN